jgi:hypothetical protein
MAKKKPAKKSAKRTPAKAPARKRAPAKKAPARKAPARKAPARKAPAKKATTKKRAPAKKAAPKKSSSSRSSSSSSKGSSQSKSSAKRSSPRKKSPPTAYEKRNAAARDKGFESYWDERQSRVRAREALEKIGHPDAASATDKITLQEIDELATLGRGESARELYYKTRRILEKYEPAPSDSQIWSLIRIFYKPRSRR